MSMTALQRKEPADAAGRTSVQRHQADIQPGRQCRHECQQCVGQLTTVQLLRDRGPRTTGRLSPDGLESTHCRSTNSENHHPKPDSGPPAPCGSYRACASLRSATRRWGAVQRLARRRLRSHARPKDISAKVRGSGTGDALSTRLPLTMSTPNGSPMKA